VRIVTPGTVTDEALLEDRKDNLLVAVCSFPSASLGTRHGIASLDLTSGRFILQQVESEDQLLSELGRLNPAELLFSEDWPLPQIYSNVVVYAEGHPGILIRKRQTKGVETIQHD